MLYMRETVEPVSMYSDNNNCPLTLNYTSRIKEHVQRQSPLSTEESRLNSMHY